MPVYLVFMLIYLPFQVLVNKITFSAVVGNLLMIQGFTGLGHNFNWYITFLVIIYLLTPIFVQMLDRACRKAQVIALVIFTVIITIPFWGSEHLILVTRIPVYILGVYFGKLGKMGVMFNRKQIASVFAVSAVGLLTLLLCFIQFKGYLWDYGLYWYSFLLITPGVCFMLSFLFMWICNNGIGKRIYSCLYIIGSCSFELYLVHIFFLEIYSYLIEINIVKKSNIYVCITMLLVAPATYGLHFAAENVKKKFKR